MWNFPQRIFQNACRLRSDGAPGASLGSLSVGGFAARQQSGQARAACARPIIRFGRAAKLLAGIACALQDLLEGTTIGPSRRRPRAWGGPPCRSCRRATTRSSPEASRSAKARTSVRRRPRAGKGQVEEFQPGCFGGRAEVGCLGLAKRTPRRRAGCSRRRVKPAAATSSSCRWDRELTGNMETSVVDRQRGKGSCRQLAFAGSPARACGSSE